MKMNNSLKEVLSLERKKYYKSYIEYLKHSIMHSEKAIIFRFQKFLRKAEYYKNKNRKIRYAYYLYKKNKLGNKLGFSIHCNTCDKGLYIAHIGCIIINGKAKIGKNCVLHGSNCIGNKNDNNDLVPVIGDNFSLGFGSVVYGKVQIASNVTIGVNSIVTKDINESGIYIGSPVVNYKKGN